VTDAAGKALEFLQTGVPDGDHHKAWMIDQLLRILTECPTVTKTAKDYRQRPYEYQALGESDEYLAFVREYEDGENGPNTYAWDIGIGP
jgi:hypothetical protein